MKGKVDTPNGIADQDMASNVPRALLADFGVDSDILRPAHVVWLDGLATFLRRRAFPPTKGKWVITITGRASKTGSDYHNRRLSERRCNAVRKHLANKLVGVSIEFAPTYLGEASPFNTKINENARDRSVEVFVVASVAPIRIDPDPPGGAERTKVFDLVVSEFLVHTIGSPVMTLPIGWCWWKMNLTVTDPDTDDIDCTSSKATVRVPSTHAAWRLERAGPDRPRLAGPSPSSHHRNIRRAPSRGAPRSDLSGSSRGNSMPAVSWARGSRSGRPTSSSCRKRFPVRRRCAPRAER